METSQQRWKRLNKDKTKAYDKDYYQKNKEAIKIKKKDYHDENLTKVRVLGCKRQKKYCKNHLNKVKEYMRNYFRELKHWAVDKLGRKCADCGLISEFDCIYDFHHEGEDSWSSNKNPSNMRIKELIKWRKADSIPIDCKLLCANCHRIKHYHPPVLSLPFSDQKS